MRKFSNTTLIVAGVVSTFLVVASLLVIASDDVVEGTPTTENVLLTSLEVLERDTDGDGLKDWEEELIGTDPTLRDTDGDGRDDKTQAGGAIATREEATQSYQEIVTTQKNTGGNLTENIAQNFFASYVNSNKETPLALRQDDIVGDLLDDLGENTPLTSYTQEELTIATDDLLPTKAYANELATTILRYPRKTIDEVVTLLQEIIDGNNEVAINQLEEQASLYQHLASDMIDISVPPALVSTHLDLANSYHKTGDAIFRMSRVRSDSIRAITNLGYYQDGLDTTIASLLAIAQHIQQHDITFEDTEEGSIWLSLVR